MGTTAIVMGATGLVGASVAQQLCDESRVDVVRTLTRRPIASACATAQNTVVDFSRLEQHAALFRGDMLFSCLGTTKKQAGSIAAQRVVDVDYQLTAARLAAANGVRHYLLVSSAYADARSSNPYTRMKGELEEAVSALPFDSISIFQPSVLVGPRDHVRVGERVGEFVLGALSWVPGVRRYRPIRGTEVARRMIDVSRAPHPGVRRYVLDEVFPVNNAGGR